MKAKPIKDLGIKVDEAFFEKRKQEAIEAYKKTHDGRTPEEDGVVFEVYK